MQDNGKFLYLDGSGNICHPTAPPCSEDSVTTASEMQEALDQLIEAIRENGMDPLTQLLGYFSTEDPTYLPEGINARNLAHRLGRDKLLSAVLTAYLERRDEGV